MPAKRSHSAARVLTLLETVAEHQPIGVRALAKLLDEDKSAVHRGLVTLADSGWIRMTGEPPVGWELTKPICRTIGEMLVQTARELTRSRPKAKTAIRQSTGRSTTSRI